MTHATTSLSADPAVRAIQDRLEITDVLYRYASTIDTFDLEGLREHAVRRPLGAVRQRRPGGRRRRGRGLDRRSHQVSGLAAPPAERLPRRDRRRRCQGTRLPHLAPAASRTSQRARRCSSGATTTSCGASRTAGRSRGSCWSSCGPRPSSTRPATSRWSAGADRSTESMNAVMLRASEPFRLGEKLLLRNRLVGTAHGAGLVADGLSQPADAEYWRRRAAGGAAMLIVGGTVTAPGIDLAPADRDRGVARGGVARNGVARRGDPLRRRGRGLPARAPGT